LSTLAFDKRHWTQLGLNYIALFVLVSTYNRWAWGHPAEYVTIPVLSYLKLIYLYKSRHPF